MLNLKSTRKKILKKYGIFLNAARSRWGMLAVFTALSLTTLFITLSSINVLAVSVDGQEVVIKTLNSDVYDTMEKNGIEIEPNDIVSVTGGSDKIDVSITRTFPVSLRVDGVTAYEWVSGGTVADLLQKNEVYIASQDTVSIPTDTVLTSGLDVVVTRISSNQYVEYASIPFTTKTEKIYFGSSVGSMPADVSGAEGVRKLTKIDTIVDGVVTATKIVSNVIEKQPVTAVKYVAIKAPTKLVNGKELSYSKVFTMTASAYTANAGKNTATGAKAQVGCVSINPNTNKNLKLGDKLYIETTDGSFVYGYCTVNDTGRLGSGIDVDVFLPSVSDCYSFGKRAVKVYVLN